jgi:hypothetical protein
LGGTILGGGWRRGVNDLTGLTELVENLAFELIGLTPRNPLPLDIKPNFRIIQYIIKANDSYQIYIIDKAEERDSKK